MVDRQCPSRLLLLAALAAACVAEKREATPDTSARGAEAGAPGRDTAAVSAAVSDRDVRMLMALVNASEISAGAVATRKGAVADVRSFGSDMVAEHTAMQQSVGVDTAAGAGTSAAGMARADTLRRVSRRQSDSLGALPRGAAFDRAYIDQQLSAHSMALDSLLSWRRQTRSGELRTLIDSAVPKVRSHLDRARAVQASLGGVIRVPVGTAPDTAPAPAGVDTTRRRPVRGRSGT